MAAVEEGDVEEVRRSRRGRGRSAARVGGPWGRRQRGACGGKDAPPHVVRVWLRGSGLSAAEGAGDRRQPGEQGWATHLYWASYFGHFEVVTLLLRGPGIDVNQAGKNGKMLLYWASYFGHFEVVTLLRAAPGIDVNESAADGQTPLVAASSEGHAELVSLLLGAPGIRVLRADRGGITAMDIARNKDVLVVLEVVVAIKETPSACWSSHWRSTACPGRRRLTWPCAACLMRRPRPWPRACTTSGRLSAPRECRRGRPSSPRMKHAPGCVDRYLGLWRESWSGRGTSGRRSRSPHHTRAHQYHKEPNESVERRPQARTSPGLPRCSGRRIWEPETCIIRVSLAESAASGERRAMTSMGAGGAWQSG